MRIPHFVISNKCSVLFIFCVLWNKEGNSDMLQKDRLYRVQEKMKQAAMPQMLVTDPMAIYWLCGKLFAPGERFLGLLLQTKEESPAVLIVNELFRFDEELAGL